MTTWKFKNPTSEKKIFYNWAHLNPQASSFAQSRRTQTWQLLMVLIHVVSGPKPCQLQTGPVLFPSPQRWSKFLGGERRRKMFRYLSGSGGRLSCPRSGTPILPDLPGWPPGPPQCMTLAPQHAWAHRAVSAALCFCSSVLHGAWVTLGGCSSSMPRVNTTTAPTPAVTTEGGTGPPRGDTNLSSLSQWLWLPENGMTSPVHCLSQRTVPIQRWFLTVPSSIAYRMRKDSLIGTIIITDYLDMEYI